MSPNRAIFTLLVVLAHAQANAEQPNDFVTDYSKQAAALLDAARGEQFFKTRHGDWSCSTCHTNDPRVAGKHAVTDKHIEPMAPAVNPERFTDRHKVEKWFKRNCNDVLKRECTAQEKGDVVAYLASLSK